MEGRVLVGAEGRGRYALALVALPVHDSISSHSE